MKLFFLHLHREKETKPHQAEKNVRNTSPAAPTIRFRRWQQGKAYACVSQHRTVCHHRVALRKSVADSSLSKQKTAGTARHARMRGKRVAWKGETEGRETDTGVPLGSSGVLTSSPHGAGNVPARSWNTIHPPLREYGRTRHVSPETKENKRYGLPEAMQQNDELHRPGNPQPLSLSMNMNPRKI